MEEDLEQKMEILLMIDCLHLPPESTESAATILHVPSFNYTAVYIEAIIRYFNRPVDPSGLNVQFGKLN